MPREAGSMMAVQESSTVGGPMKLGTVFSHPQMGNDPAVWKDFAHAMFNLQEFIYIP